MDLSDIQKVKITLLSDEIGVGISWNTYEKGWMVVSFIKRGNSGKRFHREDYEFFLVEDYEFELRFVEFRFLRDI